MKKNIILLWIAAVMFAPLRAQDNSKTPIGFDDIFKKGVFSAKFAAPFNVMNDGLRYTALEADGEKDWKIVAYQMETGNVESIILSSKNLSQKITPDNYTFSDDESMVLLTSETERIYRHSTRSLAWIVNLKSGLLVPIEGAKVMYPTISPDNQNLAYVKDNNLYVFNFETKKETPITTDGKTNEIINGGVDWVYEEEFSMSQGFQWSPDGKNIAFFRFDESEVMEFSMDIWGNLYPSQEKWKYPKAGENNSRVDVLIANITNGNTVTCKTGSENDQYLPRIKWTQTPDLLSVQRLNRKQNQWELLFFKAGEAAAKEYEVILSESSNTYIDISDNLFFIPNTKQFIYTSEKSGFNHIYCFDYGSKNEIQITNGNWDVTGISGVDESGKLIYYTSSEVSPIEDHLYAINFKGKGKKSLSPDMGNHTITMGKGNKYFTDMASTINQPYAFKLYRSNGDLVRNLELNESLKTTMTKFAFGSSDFGTLTTKSGNELNYWIMKPYNFDPNKKYPVLMHVYGGPGHNTVRNSYGGRNYLWHQHLTTLGYVVVSVDNRGTGNRGREFKHSTYLQLGKLELQDQTEAAQWFRTQTWADSTRIGIWGWSFGGYMSSLCISKSADVFKTAIAVAPVTNWRYYDNIYTERFLQKPQDNAKGYDENSPINYVNGIKGNYLIIHGTGDDNVHFQNSVEMVNAMIKAGVKYDSEFYPNRNHGIGDRAASYHLYRRMTDYIVENL